MRRPRRGMTLTELLTVVSVIAILTSMMSPVLMRAHKEAIRRNCMGNIKEISVGLQLVANSHFGKLPQCFDQAAQTTSPSQNKQPIEDTWWYRKVARVLFPTAKYKDIDNTSNTILYDHLNLPYHAKYRNDNSGPNWWRDAGKDHVNLQRFRHEQSPFRCPATKDFVDGRFDQRRTKANGRDKDRAYDDNYGYNNTGFAYAAGHGKDADRENLFCYTVGNWFFEESRLYHGPNDSNVGGSSNTPISGYYPRPGDSTYDPDKGYIGCLSDIYDPGGTILLMDYIKADMTMDADLGTDDRGAVTVRGESRLYPDGARFRHGGRANVLFADGHIEGYRDRIFRSRAALGRPKQGIHWTVYRRPPTP